MNPDEKFVHLHVHTEYSLLDGLSQIDRLVKRAKELEMPSLAITDHGVMYGVVDFFRACVKEGIRPVIGMEGYLSKRGMYQKETKDDRNPYHMLLLAKNQTGYQNLLKLASKAQLEGFYRVPRIDEELMAQHSEGLVATTGCLGAKIPQAVMNGNEHIAEETIGKFQEIFGPENFYLELQYHDIDVLEQVNQWLASYRKSGHTPVQFLATNDVHYVLEEDHDPHDTLLCIQTGKLKTEANRLSMSDPSYHLTSHEEMEAIFARNYSWLPDEMRSEALLNTAKVASMCDVDLETEGYHLPLFPVPEGYNEQSYLRYLVEKGRRWRYGDDANKPVYTERMEHELHIIHSMGFDTYFLIVWDLCEFARHADIWWNVRGSGAGSLVAYCLGITNIDPIQNSLIFERFLNPGRQTMPDIDLDYPDDRRAEMIEYSARKYGSDKVAAIITFGTMGAKNAIKDVGRALDLDVNSAADLIPQEAKVKPIEQYVDALPELQGMLKRDPKLREAIDTAKLLQGIARHASTHAAGVIIADQPLVNYIPLNRLTSGDTDGIMNQVTQFPMETCESLGLLKVDFLGLSTLTYMRRASDLIYKHYGERWTIQNIPYRPHEGDNLTEQQERENEMLAEAFELISRGETIGVFQVESPGMQDTLRGMQPWKYEHIIAAISLYRPGPMEYIPDFNDRMHGKKDIHYHHPALEPILGETYGICLTGDTSVFDAITGERFRLDELQDKAGDFYIQSVDENFRSVKSKVTHWIDNGQKPVYEIKLKNGFAIKATADHPFLTEVGWTPVEDLAVGDYVGTAPKLAEPEAPMVFERRKLRVLAYLISDGSLASGASVDFVNQNPALIEEYVRCLSVFDDVTPSYTDQVRDVTRVGVRSKYTGKSEHSLLRWMRELGFKKPPHVRKHPAGVRSHEKSIPDFVFQLSDDDVAFFVASMWDCDGYIGAEIAHYKTISPQLAQDTQSLLLRLGFAPIVYTNDYTTDNGNERTAYQVSVYDIENFITVLHPYLISEKREVVCDRRSDTTIDRRRFVDELDGTISMSRRQLMATYGIDRQHFSKKAMQRPRISGKVVCPFVEKVTLSQTTAALRVNWDKIVSIEPAGEEHVYDLTVAGTHNFVANHFIVHNCIYQEQIMQIASEMFGYPMSEADLMRRAVSKKKQKELVKHKSIFLERGPENGIPEETAKIIFDDIEKFANYGFNKCVVGDTQIVDAETGRIHTVEALYTGNTDVNKTLSLDIGSGKLVSRHIEDVMFNGVKPVYRLETIAGRTITATDNHPFYTETGWRNLGELQVGDKVAGTTVINQRTLALAIGGVNDSSWLKPQSTEWDEIVSIEYVGEEPTYDLTIEGTHNFVANDIIVHNSHAADYAMITVQTAFLKTHYPEEYMAALLTVYRETADKMSTLLEECGRLGIPVLAPSVNHSTLDFDIQEDGDGTRKIRFGMAAVKNASVNEVQYIIDVRQQEGEFESLTDFCQKVDLRHVGKRTLESLAKVGAFDELTDERGPLLAALDQMTSYSAGHHHAREVGQISMFGGDDSGFDDTITLPTLSEKDRPKYREKLDWEKELLGFFVTDHPVDDIMRRVDKSNVLSTSELRKMGDLNARERRAAMIGLVTGIRDVTTRKGDAMAIVSLEDRYGTIETVFFPRTWTKYRDTVRGYMGEVVMVRGKADKRRGTVQIICDDISQNFPQFQADRDHEAHTNGHASNGHAASEPTHSHHDGDDMPPPRDYSGYDDSAPSTPAKEQPAAANAPAPTSTQHSPDDRNLMQELANDAHLKTEAEIQERVGWWVTVYFQPDEDDPSMQKSRRRLKRIHGTFLEYPGTDNFTIVLEMNDQSYRWEFPEAGTQWCEALEHRLVQIVGAENIEIFEKT